MKEYILKAMKQLEKTNQFGLGYSTKGDYTQDIEWGEQVIQPKLGTTSCCVSAVSQVILMAFNYYMDATNDLRPLERFKDLRHWSGGTNENFLKFWIWAMSSKSAKSTGTADAFVKFKIGEGINFREIRTGDFINYSRNNNSGHSVVFCHHADKKGEVTNTFDLSNVGFYYLSSQGRRATHFQEAGINYRIGLWEGRGLKKSKFPIDNGILFPKYFYCARLWSPEKWK